MRSGTEDAYGWEYERKLAYRCFEPVWLEYHDEMPELSMEQCLNREAVSLWNQLLSEHERFTYQARRTTKEGKLAFLVEPPHMEAYAADGSVLLNVDVDADNRISGWKKDDYYTGDFVDGLRHGKGTGSCIRSSCHGMKRQRMDMPTKQTETTRRFSSAPTIFTLKN